MIKFLVMRGELYVYKNKPYISKLRNYKHFLCAYKDL